MKRLQEGFAKSSIIVMVFLLLVGWLTVEGMRLKLLPAEMKLPVASVAIEPSSGRDRPELVAYIAALEESNRAARQLVGIHKWELNQYERLGTWSMGLGSLGTLAAVWLLVFKPFSFKSTVRMLVEFPILILFCTVLFMVSVLLVPMKATSVGWIAQNALVVLLFGGMGVHCLLKVQREKRRA